MRNITKKQKMEINRRASKLLGKSVQKFKWKENLPYIHVKVKKLLSNLVSLKRQKIKRKTDKNKLLRPQYQLAVKNWIKYFLKATALDSIVLHSASKQDMKQNKIQKYSPDIPYWSSISAMSKVFKFFNSSSWSSTCFMEYFRDSSVARDP